MGGGVNLGIGKLILHLIIPFIHVYYVLTVFSLTLYQMMDRTNQLNRMS